MCGDDHSLPVHGALAIARHEAWAGTYRSGPAHSSVSLLPDRGPANLLIDPPDPGLASALSGHARNLTKRLDHNGLTQPSTAIETGDG